MQAERPCCCDGVDLAIERAGPALEAEPAARAMREVMDFPTVGALPAAAVVRARRNKPGRTAEAAVVQPEAASAAQRSAGPDSDAVINTAATAAADAGRAGPRAKPARPARNTMRHHTASAAPAGPQQELQSRPSPANASKKRKCVC